MDWLIFVAGILIGAIIGVIVMALMAAAGREDEIQRISKRCRELDLSWRSLAHLILEITENSTDYDDKILYDTVNNELIELGYLSPFEKNEKMEG